MTLRDGAPDAGGVRLRAVTADDVPLLDAWRGDPEAEGEFNDFGPKPARSLAERVASGSLVGAEGGMLVVEAAGEVVGTVGWDSVRYGPNEQSRCFNIGIALAPHGRRRGIGVVAQRLLADYLFATTPVNRVEASTDVENIPEQKALDRAGFRREGVIRGAQFRRGTWHDLIGYARLRSDP